MLLGIDKDGQFTPLMRGVGTFCPFWRNPLSFRSRLASIAVEEGADDNPVFIFAKEVVVRQESDRRC